MKDRRVRGETRDVHTYQIVYTDEEREFLMAIDRLRQRLGRVPTLVEAFRLAKLLGWSKVGDSGPLPVFRRQ